MDGDPRISVAVLDGPVDISHPCFATARLTFPTGQAGFGAASRAAAHGTHVASVIFGRGGGVEGIAPDCRGIVIPVFSDAADGLGCSQLDVARAILAALENGADVINISGGEIVGSQNAFLADALRKCEEAGVLVVAAAGNDGGAVAHAPACSATVLAVGASDWSGGPLAFSNFSPAYIGHGLVAPGDGIAGAVPGGGTVRRSGTSYATPIVSGIAARLLSLQLQRGEARDARKIRQLLLDTAVPCSGDAAQRCLAGRLSPGSAILQLHGGRKGMSNSETLDRRHESGAGAILPSDAGLAAEAPGSSWDGGANPVPAGIEPSDCGCGCGGEKKQACGCGGANVAAQAPPQRVFALGQIGFDFGTEARRDSFRQLLPPGTELSAQSLIQILERDGDLQPEVERITWTLNVDQTPIYALRPVGAFAFNGYAQIFQAFKAQNRMPGEARAARRQKADDKPISLFAIAGLAAGSTRLMSGETVPILAPSARGIVWWDIDAAIQYFMDRSDKGERDRLAGAEGAEDFNSRVSRLLGDFKNLITRKYRNLGVLGRERALNFAATGAYRAFELLREMIGLGLIIDDIVVLPSPACRTGSECYDVRIKTFRQSDTTASLRIFQFTVDVSDSLPVSIGDVAVWSERPKD